MKPDGIDLRLSIKNLEWNFTFQIAVTAVVLMTTQLCTRVKVVGQALLHQQFEKKSL